MFVDPSFQRSRAILINEKISSMKDLLPVLEQIAKMGGMPGGMGGGIGC